MSSTECLGCKHAMDQSEGWCYMFRKKPDILPCAQHDKFYAERKATGNLIRRHPELLGMMIEYADLVDKDMGHGR